MTHSSQDIAAPQSAWQNLAAIAGAAIGLIFLGFKVLALFGSASSLLATYSIEKMTLVEQPAPAFGEQQPIAGNRVRQGQRFALYFEPKHFKSRFADGHLTASLIVDLDVLDANGQLVDRAKAVHTVNYRIAAPNSRYTIQKAFANLQFNGLNYAPGRYTLRITLTERLSDEVTSADMPFELLPGTPSLNSASPLATPTTLRTNSDQASTPRTVR